MGRKKKEKKNEIPNIEDLINQANKSFGEGALIRLNDTPKLDIPSISTGSLNLDIALGVGGIPRGRIIEILGAESAGKTTLALNIIKEAQKNNEICAYIDAEHALDIDYAKKIGVNTQNLILSQPEYGEQALGIAEFLIESKKVAIIVIDSVASLVPKAELEGEMEDTSIALQARLMSKALRKLTALISKTNTCVIFINQLRSKIGVMFGSSDTTSGGRALKFYTSIRIDLRKIKTLKKGDEVIGAKIKAKVIKNKVAPPFRVAEMRIYHDEGISYTADIVDLALIHGILTKSGAWINYKDKPIGQGRDGVKQVFKENQELSNEIKTQILKIINNE